VGLTAKYLSLLLLVTSGLFAARITPLIPTESELVATGGEVIVYFAGSTASLDSVLNLISPVNVGPFFPNQTTPVGTALSLGTFVAGDILRFRLDVSSGQSYFSGPASGNPDGVIHVAHAEWAADATIPVNGTLVGFEDLFGGGDLDYDDNSFVFTNVRSPTSVPEPSSLMLAGAGVLALGLLRRRR
jgi:hypothetical protein